MAAEQGASILVVGAHLDHEPPAPFDERAMPDPLPINARVVVPGDDLTYEYTRSGGPGGQHVNTSDTSVRIRFALETTGALRPGVKARIRAAHAGRITTSGELLVSCEVHRSRHRNIQDARARLVEIITAALVPPTPRRPTRPSRGAKKRRLDEKKKRGAVKRKRGKVRDID